MTHDIVSDSVSKHVIVRELQTLYSDFRAGRPSSLPEPILQYYDYTRWQAQLLADSTDLDWWRSNLKGAPEWSELPCDRPAPSDAGNDGAKYTHHLNGAVVRRLARYARDQRATQFMVLLAVYAGLLERYSGQGDIVIGSPTTGRHRSELRDMVGLFINTLPLRVDASGGPSFEQLAVHRRARQSAIDAYRHQDVAFDRIVREVSPRRIAGRNPIFQTLLTVKSDQVAVPAFAELDVTAINYDGGWAKLDLVIVCYETADGLAVLWQYNTSMFDESTIQRLAGQFEQLLVFGLDNPTQPVDSLPLATPEDLRCIADLNKVTEERTASLLHDLMTEQALRTPDAQAVGDETGWITYRELDERSNALAHHLISLGVRPDSRVAICLNRSIALEVALVGVLKAGGAYVPLDPSYPADRLAYMLEDCDARGLADRQHYPQDCSLSPAYSPRRSGRHACSSEQRAGHRRHSRQPRVCHLYIGFDRASQGCSPRASKRGCPVSPVDAADLCTGRPGHSAAEDAVQLRRGRLGAAMGPDVGSEAVHGPPEGPPRRVVPL